MLTNVALLFTNPVEYNQTISLLDDRSIYYIEYTDIPSVHAGFDPGRDYSLILTLSNYNRFVEDVGLGYRIKVITENNKTKIKGINWLNIFLIVYGIAISVVALKYYYSAFRNNTDKNYLYEWDSLNKVMSLYNKKTGDLDMQYYDTNYDYNYEKIEVFKDGILANESIDEDENGRTDETVYYNPSGEVVSTYKDEDQDGFFEFGEIILHDGSKIIFKDTDNDGQYDSLD